MVGVCEGDLLPGEQWITNAPVDVPQARSSRGSRWPRTAAQTAADMQASGRYAGVRVLLACDANGNPLPGYRAIVATPRVPAVH